MPNSLSKFKKQEKTIQEMQVQFDKYTKKLNETIEEMKTEHKEAEQLLLIEKMKFANDEIDRLVKKDQKLFQYYDEKLKCWKDKTLTRVGEQFCKDSWVEVTMDKYEMAEAFIIQYGTTIFEYKSKCPKKCPGYYHHYECLLHMSQIHGIKTGNDGKNRSCFYEPIRVFCMKKDTFNIMTDITKTFFGIKLVTC